LQLLQAVRDEAHRFAVSRHRARRSSRSLRGLLDEIPGIGPVRRRALLREFGSLEALRVAPAESIAAVIGPAAAARLARALAAPPDVN
jgi:excinuclease ABC subunit C